MLKTLKIRVTPRSNKSEIVGAMADGTIKIKLKAPPVNGKANEELVEKLSEHFGVSKGNVKIIKGLSSKNKVVNIGY